jgi:hypothetical protein
MPTERAVDPQKARLRQKWYEALNTQAATTTATSPAASLAARFGSFADTIQTRLDTTNGVGPTLTGSLEAQVDRALSQVIRQAPVNGSAAPGGAYGGSGGAYGGPGAAPRVAQALSAATMVGAGGTPALAPQQAALLQEAALVKGDLLAVLDTLQPLSTFADPSDVASVTAVIRAEVDMLVEEFARATLRPRVQRVRVLLGGLLGWQAASPFTGGDLGALLTLFNLGQPLVPTVLTEQQLASQGVVVSDSAQLLTDWLAYQQTQQLPPGVTPYPWESGLSARQAGLGGLGGLGPTPGKPSTLAALGPAAAQVLFRLAVIKPSGTAPLGSYTERLIQADLVLPVVGQDAMRVAGALDAIGLSQGEQETTYLTLSSLVDLDLLLPATALTVTPPAIPAGAALPVSTSVTDILDWTASMADAKTLDLVRQAGQLGLDLIADQADELFWLVVALLDPSAQTQLTELSDVQVQTELLTLARDLNLLAGLAV